MSSVIDDFKKAFQIYDTDLDGYISKLDVQDLASSIGFSIGNDRLSALDENNINLDTFLGLFELGLDDITEESILEAFRYYDKDNTGKMLIANFIQVMNDFIGELFNEDDVDEVLKELDIDDSGYFEYKPLLEKLKINYTG